jgi:hypothetical protein
MKDPDQIIFYEAILEKNLKQTVSIGEYSSIGVSGIESSERILGTNDSGSTGIRDI